MQDARWNIGYGLMQGLAPQVVPRSNDGLSREVPASRAWAFGLALILVAMVFAIDPSLARADLWLVLGLSLFGLAFAVNSSVHSYLVLAYAGSEKAAEDVGFYYAANAAGRFLGTLLSGWLYGVGGITACLWGSALLLAVGFLLSLGFPKQLHDPIRS